LNIAYLLAACGFTLGFLSKSKIGDKSAVQFLERMYLRGSQVPVTLPFGYSLCIGVSDMSFLELALVLILQIICL